MLRRPLIVLLLSLGPLTLASCGDDSLSPHQLRTLAGGICRQTATRMDRIPLPSTPDQGMRFLRAGAAKLGAQTTRLAALRPPSALRADYRKAISLGRDEAGLIEGNANAIARGADPISTFRDLQAPLAPIVREENAFWRALGIPACVRR